MNIKSEREHVALLRFKRPVDVKRGTWEYVDGPLRFQHRFPYLGVLKTLNYLHDPLLKEQLPKSEISGATP